MPLTAITTLVGSIAMLGSWFYIGLRIKHLGGAVPSQVVYLHTFFLYMGIFFLFMFAPHLALKSDPSQFPFLMAWGYVIGHVFLYLAFLSVARVMFSLAPRLARHAKVMLAIGYIVAIILTILNFVTMVNGHRPQFDNDKSVTLFNAAPIVGAGIAIYAAVAIFPTAILIIINGIRNPSARTRSFLLGAGLFLLMAAGPLHDTARTWQLYTVADVVSMLSLMVLATGVAYRLTERIVPVAPIPVANPAPAGIR